jgi:adenylate kinase family enzyme
MQRVLIIGNSGGGKSTLARKLGAKTGAPVIHLDVLFWKPGSVESDKQEFKARLTAALAAPRWIADGNFSSSWDVTMARADTVVWIDQPRWLCLVRAIWRIVKYRRELRPDMAEGCRESVDFAFYRYIWTYDAETTPKLLAALETHGAHARHVRLRSDREIVAFLERA